MLEVEELCVSYGKDQERFEIILKSLSLKCREIAVLTGVSGSGKSTLLECLALVREQFQASGFQLADQNVALMDEKQRHLVRSAMIGYMPQQGGLIPFLKLKDDFELSIKLSCRAYKELGIESPQATLADACALASDLGIGSLLNRLPQELSEGQRQRAAFVKAISRVPRVLLMDEPTSALDPNHAHKLFEEMIAISQRNDLCVLAVTHDLSLASYFNLKEYSYDPSQSTALQSVFIQHSQRL